MTKWVKELAEKYPEPAEFLRQVERSRKPEQTRGNYINDIGKILADTLALFPMAIAAWRETLAEALKAGDRLGTAKVLFNIGMAFMRAGADAEALDHLERSLSGFAELDHPVGQSACLSIIGAMLFRRGEFNRSIETQSRALAKAREGRDLLWERHCHSNLATVYRGVGNLEGALEHCRQAVRLAEQVEGQPGAHDVYQNIANSYLDLKQYEQAREYATKALRICVEKGYRYVEASCHNTLGFVALGLGDRAAALRHQAECLRLADEITSREMAAWAHVGLGNTYRDFGDIEQALHHYDLARAVMEERGMQGECLVLSGCVGQAYPNARLWVQCISACAKAVDMLETMRREHVPPDNRASYWRANVALFDMLVEAAVRAGRETESSTYSERGKGRTIADLMLARGIEPGRFKSEPLSSDEIKALAERLDRTLVLFRVTEHGTFSFVLAPSGELELVELPEFSDRRLAELVVQMQDGKPKRGWFGTYSEYKRAQDEAGRLMSDGKLSEASALLRSSRQTWFSTMDKTLAALSEELMAPVFEKVAGLGTRSESSVASVMSRGGAGRVVLVPNRALNILPLHACYKVVDGKRRYLLEDYEITYAPNCNILDLCEKREKGIEGLSDEVGQQSLFAVANPAPPYELVFSEWEVDEIAKHFKKKEVLVKAEAKQALLERGKDASILHLSTHGIHDIGSSFYSRLKLGKDEELTLEEVFEHLRLEKNWLVCLSACESGLLDYRDIADEFIGLQAGFLYAGAPTVIASLWSIADYTTALVMMKLYENIYQHKQSKAAALRNAQLWLKHLSAGEALRLLKAKEEVLEYSERMAREDISPVRRAISLEDHDSKPFSHPYFWAGYQSFGV